MFIVYESINPKRAVVALVFAFLETVVFSIAIFLRISCYMTVQHELDVPKTLDNDDQEQS